MDKYVDMRQQQAKSTIHVYAVVVHFKSGEYGVSQEAYHTLEEAQRFIEIRSGSPRKIDNTKYVDCTGLIYTIHELLVNAGEGLRRQVV